MDARLVRTRWRVSVIAVAAMTLSSACLGGDVRPSGAPVAVRPNATPVRPSPSPTYFPFDTTRLALAPSDVPGLGGRELLPGDLTIDQEAHLLYLSDPGASAIHVFDVTSPATRYVAAIPLPGPPSDIVLAPDLRRLFVSLATSQVAIVDLDPASPRHRTTSALVATNAAGKAGAIEYAPRDRTVLVTNPAEGSVTVIDAVRGEWRAKSTDLGTRLGPLRYYSVDNSVYLTTESVFHRLDPKTGARLGRYGPPAPCAGFAMDARRKEAILSCGTTPDTQKLYRWDILPARATAEYDQIGSAEAIVFNANADRYFIAAPAFVRGPAIGIFGGPRSVFVTNVPSTSVSRAVAYDETNRLVYTQGPRGILSFPSPPDRIP